MRVEQNNTHSCTTSFFSSHLGFSIFFFSPVTPDVHSTRTGHTLALIALLAKAPEKFPAMSTEGGLLEEACHKLMEVDLQGNN